MAETAHDIIMHDVKRSVVLELLRRGKRMDERALDEYRPISVQRDVIDTAEGSALAKIGTTQILIGVKIDLATPYGDRPEEGIFSTNCELLPLANPSFEAGPPREGSIELARVVDRGIRSAEVDVDDGFTKGFFLEEGKVLALYLDIYVLDHGGNMTDAASLAAMAALSSTKIPKYEDGKLIRNETASMLDIKRFPLATSLAKIEEFLLADPTMEEKVACDANITISTTKDGNVAAMQKGKGEFTKQDVLDAVDVAFKKGDELRKYIL
ncbi:exosome complex protein Rrp42 [Candidatus Micrarchaeota archaeon]|nr:exosome complex protein Rrp42 [Candidatus Micrarchaeota archaeon]